MSYICMFVPFSRRYAQFSSGDQKWSSGFHPGYSFWERSPLKFCRRLSHYKKCEIENHNAVFVKLQ